MSPGKEFKRSFTRKNLKKRDKLILEHLSLVNYVVSKFKIYLPLFVDQDDLVESGIVGLIEAAEKYDASKNAKFKTYALYRIRGSILDYLRSQEWMSRTLQEKAKMVKDACLSLGQKLNRPPQRDEIAEALNIDPAALDTLLAKIGYGSLFSLEAFFQQSGNAMEENRELEIRDARSYDPLGDLETKEEFSLLAQAIDELPTKERLVIILYYYEDLLLREISQILGISESRVSQLHHQALFVLRTKMSRSALNN